MPVNIYLIFSRLSKREIRFIFPPLNSSRSIKVRYFTKEMNFFIFLIPFIIARATTQSPWLREDPRYIFDYDESTVKDEEINPNRFKQGLKTAGDRIKQSMKKTRTFLSEKAKNAKQKTKKAFKKAFGNKKTEHEESDSYY